MPEFTCIVCPVGCHITVTINQAGINITGQGCRRGEIYALNEAKTPERMLTGIVSVKGRSRPLPVKTATPIPKEKIREVMADIKNTAVNPPVKSGQILKEDLAGTGVKLVATKNIE